MIEHVEIPCQCPFCVAEAPIHEITVKEFAGKVQLHVLHLTGPTKSVTVKVEFDVNDLQRAWNAVRRF